jgi:hypothetical protein
VAFQFSEIDNIKLSIKEKGSARGQKVVHVVSESAGINRLGNE